MKKYTYEWFVMDVEKGCNIDFTYKNHIYSVQNNRIMGKRVELYLACDGIRVSENYKDVAKFLKSVSIDAKSFEDLFQEEEKGNSGLRMISKWC